MTCNSISFTVTANLHEALVHLRQRDEDRFLWVDALCINQYDLEEKAKQIRKLHTLFKRARRVVVWLGQEALYTQLAMTWMHSFSMQYETRYGSVDGATRLARLCDLHALFEGLTELLKRPWIRRIWILQEVYSAQSVVVQCGPSEIPWNVFESLSHCRAWVKKRLGSIAPFPQKLKFANKATYEENEAASDHDLAEAQRCMDVLAALTGSSRFPTKHHRIFSGLQWNSKPKNLHCLLKETYMFHATDQRDKVYALLGIAGVLGVSPGTKPTDDSPYLVIDYDPSVTEGTIFRRLLKLFASEIQDLTFLDHLTYPADSNVRPTWQPIELPRTNIFKQLGCIVDKWRPNKGHSLAPSFLHPSIEAGEAFCSKDRLRLSGRKMETISTICQKELPTADGLTDCLEIRYVGKTERIAPLAEVDELINKIRTSDGMCEELRQILRESWWSWDLPASARPGDTIVHCKGVLEPKLLRKGPGEEYNFVGSAKLSALHYSLDEGTQRRVHEGVRAFCREWLAGQDKHLHWILIK